MYIIANGFGSQYNIYQVDHFDPVVIQYYWLFQYHNMGLISDINNLGYCKLNLATYNYIGMFYNLLINKTIPYSLNLYITDNLVLIRLVYYKLSPFCKSHYSKYILSIDFTIVFVYY